MIQKEVIPLMQDDFFFDSQNSSRDQAPHAFWGNFWYNFLVKVIAGMIFSISPKRKKGTALAAVPLFVSRKPPAVPVVPKSFSYAQNKISERSEEQLLRSKDRKSIKLRKSGKEKPYRYFNSSRASHASERKFDEPIGSAGKRP